MKLKEFLFKKRHFLSWKALFFWVLWPSLIWAIVVLFFMGCTTPKVIEQHHHHYQQADTAAIEAVVDRTTKSWREEMDSAFHAFENKYTASLTSNESEKEVITELITVSTDSVGRTLRTEQRSISRDITRELLQQEERITREFEARLSVVVDSVNDIWQMRYNSLAAHVATLDSLSNISHPTSAVTTPLFQRWWQKIKDHLLAICIALILINTCPIWLPWIKKLLRKIIPGL
jgi:hypothetical protein